MRVRWQALARSPPVPYLVLALLPLTLLALNGSWLWDSPYYHDTNVYIGYFRHYLEFTWPYTENYKLSRLPFVLPGVLSYAVFPPGFAHHLLHLLFLLGEAWLIYLLAKPRFGAKAAFVAAAAVLTFTYSHTAPSYHNQAASTYFVAALALLERPRRWPLVLRMALAGAVFAQAVTTDSIVATMAPLLLIRALALCEPRTRPRLLLAALSGVAGGVASLVVVGALNVALGGPFLYFLEQVRYSAGAAKAHQLSDVSTLQMLARYGEFSQLTFPLVTLALAFVLVIRRVWRRRWDWALLEASSWVTAMVIAALQQNAGLKMIEEPCLFHPFYAVMFLTLPALLVGDAVEQPEQPGWRFMAAVSALLLVPLCLLGLPLSRLVWQWHQSWPSMVYGVPLALAVGGVAAIAGSVVRGAAMKAGIAAAAFGLMNAVSTAPSQPAYLYQAGATCAFRREAFEAVLAADQTLAKFDPESEAHWKSVGVPLEHPKFDGEGWCTILPIETVARDVLLPRYFYTTDELLYGPRPRPLEKIVLAANTPQQMEALQRDVWVGMPGTAKTELAFEQVLRYSTFSIVLRGYDVTFRP